MLSSTPILGTPPLKPETALKHVINKFRLIVRAYNVGQINAKATGTRTVHLSFLYYLKWLWDL
jgi:hypothetical protein